MNKKAQTTLIKPMAEQEMFKFWDKVLADWYLDGWFEKLIFFFGTISLVYSIFRILMQGFW